MQHVLIKTNELSKKYKKFEALKSVTLTLETGKIYGLIGRNGAGKTTLMRLLLGVSIPTSGKIELPNKNSNECYPAGRKELEAFRTKVGSLVEFPSVYGAMTAKENMITYSKVCGIKGEEKANILLEKVGLGDTGKKRVKDFSLGMRQRLGLALALLNSPKLLVLDEPMNGLDPLGIVEIRELLKKLNQEEGITILISSHILSELYQLATDYIFLETGQIIEEIKHEELEQKIAEENIDLESFYLSLLGMKGGKETVGL